MIEFPEDEEFCVVSKLNHVSLRLTSGSLVNDDILIEGQLEVRQRFSGKWLEWTPSQSVITLSDIDKSEYHRHRVSFDIRDLLSFCLSSGPGPQGPTRRQVVFMLKDGTTHAPVEFSAVHENAFKDLLKEFVNLRRSAKDERLFLVTDFDADRVDQVTRAIDEGRVPNGVPYSEPYDRLMDGLSRVTAFLRSNVVEVNDDEEDELEQLIAEDHASCNRQESQEDFVFVSPYRDIRAQLGNSNFIDHAVERSAPLTHNDLPKLTDAEGRFKDPSNVLERIFHGGIEESLRPKLWKYLLKYYHWDKTDSENESLRIEKKELYETMKRQWTSTTEAQRRRNRFLRESMAMIGRDVERTDRLHPYFRSDDEHTEHLTNVLNTYVMFNFDLGYVQGMSDLLAPILVVMDDEADAFWCFVQLMERMEQNFEMNQNHIKLQLSKLYLLLDFVDSEFSNYLACRVPSNSRDGCHMYFCFRWMLLNFKREFRYADIQRLWEVLWTDLPCPNFQMFVCLAILGREKPTIMSNRYGVTEILKHVNDIAFQIPLDPILVSAEQLFLRLRYNSSALPEVLRELFAFK